MRVTHRSRLQIRAQNIIFVVLLLAVVGLVGWLSTQYSFKADLTAGHRNTLTDDSVKLLHTLDGPVKITAYARTDDALRTHIRTAIAKYQAVKKDISLEFVNPDLEPDQVRKLGITSDGELRVEYQGRTENVTDLSENALSNTLQRLARSGERWIAFLTGHGERDPHGSHNFDLGDFGKQLENKGFKVRTVNFGTSPAIPDNIAALVIAGPQTNLLPGEVKLIRGYVQHGGNLLWLGDPDDLHGLAPLAEDLDVHFLPGMVIDPTTQVFGIKDPSMALVGQYGPSPITKDFKLLTLFPQAAALEYRGGKDAGWSDTEFLSTPPRSWLETGKLDGPVQFDAGTDDRQGPLDIGISLTRALPADTSESAKDQTGAGDDKQQAGEQRIVVLGDGDFLSNSFLNNGGNLDLGLNIFNWLSHDDSYLSINPRSAPDLRLDLSKTASALISGGFLFFLPLVLLGAGITVWIRRRRR